MPDTKPTPKRMNEINESSLKLSSTEATLTSRTTRLASPIVMATPVLKIATFHSASLGSLVSSLPALVALRDSFPGARICSFVRAPLLPLLENFAAVDETHARPRGGLSAQAALMARLHSGDFDIALSFSQGSNALLLMWATGAQIRAGFIPSRMDALLTHKTHRNGPLRPPDAIELARGVGARPRGENARDFLHIPVEAVNKAERLRKTAGIEGDFLVVAPEHRKRGEEKSVLTGEVREVDAVMLRELANRFPLVVVGLKSAASLIRETGTTVHPIADLGGKTDVLGLAALCEASRGVVGAGAGALQMGRLYEKPVVSVLEGGEPTQRAYQLFGF